MLTHSDRGSFTPCPTLDIIGRWCCIIFATEKGTTDGQTLPASARTICNSSPELFRALLCQRLMHTLAFMETAYLHLLGICETALTFDRRRFSPRQCLYKIPIELLQRGVAGVVYSLVAVVADRAMVSVQEYQCIATHSLQHGSVCMTSFNIVCFCSGCAIVRE